MEGPLFTILLPTKNRSEIVGGAIESVLAQSCPDFELIVSDNDDSPTKTRDAVASFADPRLRYVRTSGRLAMHENWDHAFSHATGRHVLVLEDKMRMVSNALEILKGRLGDGRSPVTFLITAIQGPSLAPSAGGVDEVMLDSRRVVDQFARFEPAAFDRIPKGIDGCAPRELLAEIKANSPTGFLFSYICPDYAYGFMVLSRVDVIRHLPAPLVYVPNNWQWAGSYSNGQATYRKNELIRRFMKDLPVTSDQILERVPVKAEFLWINMVLWDFFTKYRRAGHNPSVDWARYHAFVMTLILLGRKMGADMAEERAAVRASLRRRGWAFSAAVGFHFLGQLGRQAIRVAKARLALWRKH